MRRAAFAVRHRAQRRGPESTLRRAQLQHASSCRVRRGLQSARIPRVREVPDRPQGPPSQYPPAQGTVALSCVMKFEILQPLFLYPIIGAVFPNQSRDREGAVDVGTPRACHTVKATKDTHPAQTLHQCSSVPPRGRLAFPLRFPEHFRLERVYLGAGLFPSVGS